MITPKITTKFDHQSGSYLPINSAKVYYEVIGQTVRNAPVMIVLHSSFSSMTEFNLITPKLTSAYQVIGIDSRGHGKSTLGTEDVTFQLLQEDVEAVIAHLNITEFSLLGNNAGGVVAYRLAAKLPSQVRDVTAISAFWNCHLLEDANQVSASHKDGTWNNANAEGLEAHTTLNPEPNTEAVAKAISQMWVDCSPSGFPDQRIAQITSPLLVVRGEQDLFVTEEHLTSLTALVPSVSFLTIPTAGGNVIKDQTEIFLRHWDLFLTIDFPKRY